MGPTQRFVKSLTQPFAPSPRRIVCPSVDMPSPLASPHEPVSLSLQLDQQEVPQESMQENCPGQEPGSDLDQQADISCEMQMEVIEQELKTQLVDPTPKSQEQKHSQGITVPTKQIPAREPESASQLERRCPPSPPSPPSPAPSPFSFDPRAPFKDSTMHIKARKALTRRYQSKVRTIMADSIKMIAHFGEGPDAYDTMWIHKKEMPRRVLNDIIWVRERYYYACRGEPTDEDIIWWFDAEKIVEDEDGVDKS